MQTLPTDTLTCDISRLSLWRNDPDYDYARGLMEATEGPVDRLRRWLMDKALAKDKHTAYMLFVHSGKGGYC